MPIYNSADYLRQTIDSIISQSIGFNDNIQVVLVNDGSSDDSESICLEYRNAFPENFIYISQENAGASAARNAGIPYIHGKYVNFMDADDLWDEGAFAAAFDMFENSKEAVDVIGCRMDFFESKTGFHNLDYKFSDGDFICDIFEHPSFGQYSVCSCFIRSDAIGDLRFDTRLTYGEDAKFVNQLILKKEKYGLLKSALYHIRKRSAGNSLTQQKLTSPTAYLDTATLYYKFLADISLQKYGKVIPFIQYEIINAIKYRVGHQIPDNIPQDVREQYVTVLSDLITTIDDEVICKTHNINTARRVYLLVQKYGFEPLCKMCSVDAGTLSLGNLEIGPAFEKKSLKFNKTKRLLFGTAISGTVSAPILTSDIALKVKSGNKVYECKLAPSPDKSALSYKNEAIDKVYDFSVSVPSFIKRKSPKKLDWLPQITV